MAIKYGKKRSKQHNVLYTVITAILLCTVFLIMVVNLYATAKEDAYENLHVQTKQIKDDIVLQLISDRENLTTMANFAAKLYVDGGDYSLLFESFEPIGMIENIGILNPDGTFVTKIGVVDMKNDIFFEEEKAKGVYISGRVKDVTKDDYELIRSAVPVKSDGEVVGILYGVIKPDKLGARYSQMLDTLDAQLFVYEKDSGDILIDTIHDSLGNISFLKDRKYTDGYSYEQFISTEKGNTAFRSAYKDENLHLHYSSIDEFDWMIALGRYDSQVFKETHTMASVLLFIFLLMICIIALYVIILMAKERRINSITECASNVRKELLETTDGQDNMKDALIEICSFAKSRSAIFFDTDGEFFHYIAPEYAENILSEDERKYLRTELFRYVFDFYKLNGNTVNVLCIKPNKHMRKTNFSFYGFLEEHNIKDISLSATISRSNHITILSVINAKYAKSARMLAEKVSACFSMALYNKNYLNRTILAATTDSLTGVLNRVAYKNDIKAFDEEHPSDFACVYVDVNELHICNNKYGHAAGDAMLLYVANTLKDIFYGQKLYRIGGDEFLVFCKGVSQEEVKNQIELLTDQLKHRNYNVAIGMSYRTQCNNIEEMIKEAETRMYEAKTEYYQTKEQQSIASATNEEYIQLKTGIREIDAMLSVLKEKYNGIYRVSLTDDKAKRILMPAYLKYNEDEENFSKLFLRYVAEAVEPDFHRAVTSFLNYDALKHQLAEGKIPKISYKKHNGENVALSIYRLGDADQQISDTLWVFSKE